MNYEQKKNIITFTAICIIIIIFILFARLSSIRYSNKDTEQRSLQLNKSQKISTQLLLPNEDELIQQLGFVPKITAELPNNAKLTSIAYKDSENNTLTNNESANSLTLYYTDDTIKVGQIYSLTVSSGELNDTEITGMDTAEYNGTTIYHIKKNVLCVPYDYELNDNTKAQIESGKIDVEFRKEQLTQLKLRQNVWWSMDGVVYKIIVDDYNIEMDKLIESAEFIIDL